MRINEIMDIYKLSDNPENLPHYQDRKLVPELMTRAQFKTAFVIPKTIKALGVPKNQITEVKDDRIVDFLFNSRNNTISSEELRTTKFCYTCDEFKIPFIKDPCISVWLSTFGSDGDSMTDHGISFYVSKATAQKLIVGFSF